MNAILPPITNAITNANISISGQRMAMRMIIIYAIWTLVTSVVSRVTRDEVEKLVDVLERIVLHLVEHILAAGCFASPQEAVAQVEPASAPNASDRPARTISIMPY